MTIADDDSNTITMRDGHEMEIIRDGERMRVPLTMMDSLTPLQKAVASDVAARGHDKILHAAVDNRPTLVDVFGSSDALALSRPGPRYASPPAGTTDAAVQTTLRAMRAEAYQQYDVE